MDLRLDWKGSVYRIRRNGPGDVVITDDEGESRPVQVTRLADGFGVEEQGTRVRGDAVRDGEVLWVRWKGRTYRLERVKGRGRARSGGPGDMASPMPGQVLKHLVSVGAEVEANEPLLVVEAMKMQLEIKASHTGTVVRFLAEEGEQVPAGEPLVVLEETS